MTEPQWTGGTPDLREDFAVLSDLLRHHDARPALGTPDDPWLANVNADMDQALDRERAGLDEDAA